MLPMVKLSQVKQSSSPPGCPRDWNGIFRYACTPKGWRARSQTMQTICPLSGSRRVLPVSCSSGTVTEFPAQVMVASRICAACPGSAERWNTTERTKAQNRADTRNTTHGLSVCRRMAAAPTPAPDNVQEAARNSR